MHAEGHQHGPDSHRRRTNADSPTNVLTPLMVYFPFIVTIAALMLPYAFTVLVVWLVLFVVWLVLGITLGPDSPVQL